MTTTEMVGELLSGRVVDASDVAAVTGSTARSVTRWGAAEASPRRESEERLLELKAVLDALDEALSGEPARIWLRSPNPSLDWRKPLDLVAQGEYRRVIGAALALADGVTA